MTGWNKRIVFNPSVLLSGDSGMIWKFINMLSLNDKERLKNEIEDIDFEQSVSFRNDKYAYQIIDDTLILIKRQSEFWTIVSIYKTEWYDI